MTTELEKQNKKNNNPTGKGGFGDRPEDINRGGRPKNEASPTYWIRKFLMEKDTNNPNKTRLQIMMEAFVTEGFNSMNLHIVKEIIDRLDGKAPQTIKHDGGIDIGAREVAQLLQEILDDDSETENGDTNNS